MKQQKCLLNTRPLDQGLALNQSIEILGWRAVHWPALIIEPKPSTWLNTMPDLALIHTAIFISPNAVHFYFKTLAQNKILWPDKIQSFALGPASSKALSEYNVASTCIPMLADSEHLLRLESLINVSNRGIMIVKGEGGRDLIERTLLSRKAKIYNVDVYVRTAPRALSDELIDLWQKDAIDLILFTSQQSMQNLWFLLGKTAKEWMRHTPCLVISPRLAKIASTYGIQCIIQTTWPNMLNSIKEFSNDSRQCS